MKNWLKVIGIKLICIIGVTDFKYKGSWFRSTSFYYRYKFQNGNTSDPIPTFRVFANCIGGVGVCGMYPFISEIEEISFSFRKCRLFFFKQQFSKSHINYILEGFKKAKLYRGLKKSLTKEQVSDFFMKRAIESAMKTFDK